MTVQTAPQATALAAELAQTEADRTEAQALAAEAAQRCRQNPHDDAALRARREAADRAEAFEGRVADLTAQLAEARGAEALAAATSRLAAIEEELPRTGERRAEILTALAAHAAGIEEQLGLLAACDRAQTEGQLEALVLAERFDLPLPALAPHLAPTAAEALRRVQALQLPAPEWRLPSALSKAPHRSGTEWSLQRVLQRIAHTPTGALLAAVGPGLLGDATAWEAQRRQHQERANSRADQARRAELASFDAWLLGQLAAGPVLLSELEAAAEVAGLRVRPAQNSPGASVREGAERCGVLGLEERLNGPTWWALPGKWDATRWHGLGGGGGHGLLR